MTTEYRKTVVVTGASSGVGRAAALRFAREGWNVVGLGRDPQRSADTLKAMRSLSRSGATIEMVTGDLSLLADTNRMADAVRDIFPAIDGLCNNAGGVRDRMIVTDEGNEATFAGNHLGHFLLTKRLMPSLRSAAGRSGQARVVNVSSEGHHQAPEFDWDDLQGTRAWVSGRNYCLAKLCNLLFTHELAKRYAAEGIIAHGMHPGEAATNFASHAVPEMKAYMSTLDMISPEVASDTMFWLVASEEAGRMNDGYFFDCGSVPASPKAHDDALSARLWDESEKLLARSGF